MLCQSIDRSWFYLIFLIHIHAKSKFCVHEKRFLFFFLIFFVNKLIKNKCIHNTLTSCDINSERNEWDRNWKIRKKIKTFREKRNLNLFQMAPLHRLVCYFEFSWIFLIIFTSFSYHLINNTNNLFVVERAFANGSSKETESYRR